MILIAIILLFLVLDGRNENRTPLLGRKVLLFLLALFVIVYVVLPVLGIFLPNIHGFNMMSRGFGRNLLRCF